MQGQNWKLELISLSQVCFVICTVSVLNQLRFIRVGVCECSCSGD